jgi:hypothetical protein
MLFLIRAIIDAPGVPVQSAQRRMMQAAQYLTLGA